MGVGPDARARQVHALQRKARCRLALRTPRGTSPGFLAMIDAFCRALGHFPRRARRTGDRRSFFSADPSRDLFRLAHDCLRLLDDRGGTCSDFGCHVGQRLLPGG